MIKIFIEDNNGTELSNCDTVRYLEITADMQQEHDPFYQHQIGVIIKMVEVKFDPQEEMDDSGYVGAPNNMNYDRNGLCELFNLPVDIGDEEFKECIVDYINEELGLNLYLDHILDLINGVEIIKN